MVILFHVAYALHEVVHAYGGFSGFGSLVAHQATAAVKRVLLCVDSEYSEYDGGVAVGV